MSIATSTRSRKRGAEPDTVVSNRAKQNKICSSRNNDFLGFCSLQEIDYYFALKLDFEQHRHEAAQNNADFALLVAKKTNVVARQVRKYSKLTAAHHNNAVHDVLILIQHARTVLMDKNKQRRYDNIIFHKNAKVLKIFDTLINQLDQVNDDLPTALTVFENSVQFFNAGIENVITSTLSEALENWLAAQPVVMKKPTSTNRVLITWISLLTEQNFDKQQKKELIIKEFSIYGEIVNVYVCDIDNNTAIVEYKTPEAQRQAIDQNQSQEVRFTVTEYMLTKFYNSRLRAKLRDEMNIISGRLSDMQQHLMLLQSRYAT
ncbi:DnaJ domain protein [Choristoneura diversana nucleopolyhedrovirus]|nr:DnaJ domain protein [Choristoneura diversana nucleopolyhedrovirus]